MLIAIIFIFYPFVMQMPEKQVDEHLAQNVQAHEQRLKQIQMQLDGALFTQVEAQSQRTQSARQLLKDEGQSKRVNTELKSYMNIPVVMSIALIGFSFLFYFDYNHTSLIHFLPDNILHNEKPTHTHTHTNRGCSRFPITPKNTLMW